jgi:predicted nucleotidyltransferase
VETRLFDLPVERRGETIRRLAGALEGERDIVFGYLYGSFAGAGPFHDIDVAVYLAGPVESHSRRALDLADRLSQVARYPIDVRALNEAPLSFQFRALQGTLLVSRDDDQLSDFIERTGLRYLDIAPRLRAVTREAFVR